MANFLNTTNEEAIFDDRVYTNYPINMDLVTSFRKCTIKDINNNYVVPAIKFFFVANSENTMQWHFSSVEARDIFFNLLYDYYVDSI